MTATGNRFSLSSLFLVAIAFAAYQSGRLKEDQYARAAQMAEADAAGLRKRTKDLEQQARTWKSIALESRSLVDSTGTHFRRWDLNTTSIRAADYPEKLDALGIKLLTISPARKLYVLSNFSTHLQVVPTQTFPTCGGIVEGGSREQELVERAGLREMPTDVLMLLPQALVESLEAQELARAKRMGLKISQIEATSFSLVHPADQAWPFVVRSISASPSMTPSK